MATDDKLQLPWPKVQQALQLLEEVHEIPDAKDRRRRLIRGIEKMFDAAMVCTGTVRDCRPGGRGWLVDGSASEAARGGKMLDAVRESGTAVNPAIAQVQLIRPGSREGDVVTRRRDEVLADPSWYSSPFVEEIMRPDRLDHGLYSMHPDHANAVDAVADCVAMWRPWGAPAFGD